MTRKGGGPATAAGSLHRWIRRTSRSRPTLGSKKSSPNGRAPGGARSRPGSSAPASTATSRRTPTTTRRRTSRATTRRASVTSRSSCGRPSSSRDPKATSWRPAPSSRSGWRVTTTPTSYLVGSIEERSDDFEVLSTSSPLGQALLEHGPGRDGQLRRPPAHVRGRDRERPAARVNLVGHVAVALAPRGRRAVPSTGLPRRVHAPRPRGDRPGAVGPAPRVRSGGAWSSTTRATRCSTSPSGSEPSNRELRDVLVRRGRRLRRGRGRARTRGWRCCSTAGWWRARQWSRPRQVTLDAVGVGRARSRGVWPARRRQAAWVERLHLIGSSLAPRALRRRPVRRRAAAPHDRRASSHRATGRARRRGRHRARRDSSPRSRRAHPRWSARSGGGSPTTTSRGEHPQHVAGAASVIVHLSGRRSARASSPAGQQPVLAHARPARRRRAPRAAAHAPLGDQRDGGVLQHLELALRCRRRPAPRPRRRSPAAARSAAPASGTRARAPPPACRACSSSRCARRSCRVGPTGRAPCPPPTVS